MVDAHENLNNDNQFLSLIWKDKRVVCICVFIALGQFQYGYDSAAVSGFQSMTGFLAVFGYVDPESPLNYNLETSVQTLIQSLMQLGGFVASLFIFKFGAFISNRVGLWTGSAFSVLAVILQMSSIKISALYMGRLFLGVSNGFYLTYSATYLGEIAPTYLRGSAVGLVTFQTSFGALIGILIDNYTAKYEGRTSYLIPLGVMFIVPAALSIGILFLPESPRHYIRLGSDENAANAIRILRGIYDEDQLAAQVTTIKDAWVIENRESQSVHLIDTFRGSDFRRTILSLCCSISQTASGVIFFSSYSVYFYAQAGVKNEFVWVMMSLAIALTGNMGAFIVMKFVKRRILLGVSSIVNSAIMFVIAGVYTRLSDGSYTAAQILIAMGTLFTWVYGIGQGPVLWALTVEIPSQRLRSKTVGLATGCNYLFAWIATYCSPYFINPNSLNWGPKYCYIWGVSNVVLGMWAFIFVPDVGGKSLEQITDSMTTHNDVKNEETGSVVELREFAQSE